jgi:hypothetical protein
MMKTPSLPLLPSVENSVAASLRRHSRLLYTEQGLESLLFNPLWLLQAAVFDSNFDYGITDPHGSNPALLPNFNAVQFSHN